MVVYRNNAERYVAYNQILDGLTEPDRVQLLAYCTVRCLHPFDYMDKISLDCDTHYHLMHRLLARIEKAAGSFSEMLKIELESNDGA